MSWDEVRDAFPVTRESVYLNAASQGPIPDPAHRVRIERANEDQTPFLVPPNDNFDVPTRTRRTIGRFLGLPESAIALLPGTSWGINAVARGLRLQPGSRVLCARGAFPANVHPWRRLKADGVAVDFVGRDGRVTVDDVRDRLVARTRVVALSIVHFATGWRLDLEGIGALCREKGVFFCLDGTQAVGAADLDFGVLPVDAVACAGHKWLCSPVGTGFLAVHPEAASRLEPRAVGWMSFLAEANFSKLVDYDRELPADGRRFELGSPSIPLLACFERSVRFLHDIGRSAVAARIRDRVRRIEEALRSRSLSIRHPEASRAGIIAFEHPEAEAIVQGARKAGIHVSHREGAVRLSPHIYTAVEEIEAFFEFLDGTWA